MVKLIGSAPPNDRTRARFPRSKEEWQRHWFDEGKRKIMISAGGKEYEGGAWIHGKELRVFKCPHVDERVLYAAVNGINEMLEEIGLRTFIIDPAAHYYGNDSGMARMAMEASGHGGLDYHALGDLLVTKRAADSEQYGVVFITCRHFTEPHNWGSSEYTKGILVMSLPGKRKENKPLIYRIAKHEAAHLLGFNEHHETRAISDYGDERVCLMNPQPPTRKLCGKERDALIRFWQGIEERTGERFLDEAPS